jgi:hypothetical protein
LADATEESSFRYMGFRIAGTVTAVPEPSSPVLLLAGLLLTGAAVARRARGA